MPIEAFFIKIHSDVPKNDLNDSTVRLRGINAMFYSYHNSSSDKNSILNAFHEHIREVVVLPRWEQTINIFQKIFSSRIGFARFILST